MTHLKRLLIGLFVLFLAVVALGILVAAVHLCIVYDAFLWVFVAVVVVIVAYCIGLVYTVDKQYEFQNRR
jgi:membrane protein YdbS with pleckstrin-like domain